ncbi:hypothetical protein ACPPVQ_02200 [Diaminobutyricibacter sp. McL0618]|uniref:hypothetical protein n=1 Tax=Leifsonia sp. McL0618 TaxID=3415677 RepID=UPI003CEE0948
MLFTVVHVGNVLGAQIEKMMIRAISTYTTLMLVKLRFRNQLGRAEAVASESARFGPDPELDPFA